MITYIKNHKRLCINILLILVLLSLYSLVGLSYRLCHNTVDTYNMNKYYDIINEQVYDIDTIGFSNLGIDNLVRINSKFMNDAKADPKMWITDLNELDAFVNQFEFTPKSTNWVNSYIKYSVWNWAEYCLDGDSDEYWHMKYIASDKVASYNYGIIIKYKFSGWLITNAGALAFWCSFVTIFIFIYWMLCYWILPFIRQNKDIGED